VSHAALSATGGVRLSHSRRCQHKRPWLHCAVSMPAYWSRHCLLLAVVWAQPYGTGGQMSVPEATRAVAACFKCPTSMATTCHRLSGDHSGRGAGIALCKLSRKQHLDVCHLRQQLCAHTDNNAGCPQCSWVSLLPQRGTVVWSAESCQPSTSFVLSARAKLHHQRQATLPDSQ
jgi:hypothetical protein